MYLGLGLRIRGRINSLFFHVWEHSEFPYFFEYSEY